MRVVASFNLRDFFRLLIHKHVSCLGRDWNYGAPACVPPSERNDTLQQICKSRRLLNYHIMEV